MVHCEKGRGFLKTFMKSEINLIVLVHAFGCYLDGRGENIDIKLAIKQVVRDRETGSDSKINVTNWKSDV